MVNYKIKYAGIVNADGTTPDRDGFTVEKTGLGTYRVDFDEVLSSNPIIVLTPITVTSGRGSLTLKNVQKTSFEVLVNDMYANFVDYLSFYFTVIIK